MSKNVELNLKQFKHVCSDEGSTTLQHKDGHQLKISHKPLSKEARAQLEALASSQSKAETKAQEPKKMYADGGEVADDTGLANNGIHIESAQAPAVIPLEQAPQSPAPYTQLDPITGTMRSVYQSQPDVPVSLQEVASKGMMGAILHPDALSKPVMGQDPGAQPSLMPSQPMVESAQQAPAAATSSVEDMYRGGFNSSLQGLQQEAKAKSGLAQEVAKQREQQIQAQQVAQDTYQSSLKDLEAERQAHIKDIQEGHIDPNKYWTGDKDGNGSHSKIAAGIGMIIAGFNPTNNPNQAISFLKTQMEQNLQAQAKNLDSKQNLLSANLKQFNNLQDATQMTRIMQHDVMANQLELAAAKAGTPMAKAQLLQAAGKLKMETAPMFQQFAMRQAMMKLTNGDSDPANTSPVEHMISMARAMGNTEYAKDLEAKLIPGIGLAKIPVPESIRKEITEKTTLNDAANDLMQYSKSHTNLIPGTKEYNFGVAKALAFQQKIREGLLGTVFRESEKPLLEKFVDDNPAGAFKAFTTQPKIRAIIESNNLGLHDTMRSYGLRPTAAMQQTRPEIAIGATVMGKDGRQYKRVGNAMVPIK